MAPFYPKKTHLCVKKHPLTCKHIWRDIQNEERSIKNWRDTVSPLLRIIIHLFLQAAKIVKKWATDNGENMLLGDLGAEWVEWQLLMGCTRNSYKLTSWGWWTVILWHLRRVKTDLESSLVGLVFLFLGLRMMMMIMMRRMMMVVMVWYFQEPPEVVWWEDMMA